MSWAPIGFRGRKTFKIDQDVEIQREPGAPWEPARYTRPVTGMRGWHSVELPDGAKRRINSMSGMDTDADDPQGYLTGVLIVPTRRIR